MEEFEAKGEFETLIEQASMLMVKQQWDAALELAKEYARERPEQAKPWTVVADIAEKARDKGGKTFVKYNEEAIAAATEIILLQPWNANAHAKRGVMFLYNKDVAKAEQDFTVALAHKPDFFAALYGLGNIALARHQWAEAEQYYQETIKQSDDSAAYNALGVSLRKQGRHQEALEPLQTAMRLKPKRAKYRLAYASCLEQLGRTKEAYEMRKGLKPREGIFDE